MQQWYQCPTCGAQVAFGVGFCGNCRTPLNWPTQQQSPPPPPPQYQLPPQYQQQYQQPGGGAAARTTKEKPSKLGIIFLGIILLALAAVGSCVVCVMLPGTSESPAPSLSSDTEFQIKISGTAGLPFSGSYMVVTSGGQSVSKSVDGSVPTQYSVEGMMVSVAFQKQTEDGTLKVEILREGNVVNSSDTTAAYGVVSVATD